MTITDVIAIAAITTTIITTAKTRGVKRSGAPRLAQASAQWPARCSAAERARRLAQYSAERAVTSTTSRRSTIRMIVGAAADREGESASKINHRRAMGDHRPSIFIRL